MARITDDSTSGQADHNPLRIQAEPGARLDLPSNEFVSDSQILRDGQDLILRTSDGSEIIVENYFLAEPAPMLISAGGAALTPELVDSFAKPLDGIQLAQKGSMDDSSPVGMLKEVSGDATVTHANGVTEKASIGTPIYQGDIVQTKGEGAVNIMFVDETTFSVSSNARLAIDEYVFDPATQSGETNFSVMQGVFVFTSGLIGREDPDDVKIETPVGSIGIRGTTIMGTIDPDGQSQITVVEGAIVVTNDTGEQTLSQQYETVTIDGYTSDIVHEGTLTAEKIGENYNVLRTVSAQLFSQIDDNATVVEIPEGEITPDGTESEPDSTLETAPPESSPETEAPADTPVEGTEETKSEADMLAPEPLMMDQEAEFDLAAGTETKISEPYTTSNTLVTSKEAFLSPTSSPTVDFKTTTTETNTTTTTNTTFLGGTTTTPQPYDLLVNTYIGAGGPHFIPGLSGSNFQQGDSVISLGDYNHDGQADFAFTNQMELVLHLPVNSLDLTSPYGLTPGLSHTAAYLGDINRDGIGDLILGSSAEGGGQGLVTIMDLNDPATTYWQIAGAAGTTEFGDSVSGIGDFNGDGYNDMLVGAPAFGGGTSHSYVIYGAANFYGSSIDLTYMGTTPTDPEGFRIDATINTYMGETIVGLQDFNGDGYSDFATSKPGSDSIGIVYGSATTLTSSTITGINATNEIPMAYVGDMNGGGKSDLAIYEENTDTLHILFGETALAGTQTLASVTNKVSIVSSTGTIISGGFAGDFNGDGFDDIAVASRNGSIVDLYVVYGRPGMSGTIDLATIHDANSFHARIDLGGAAFDFDNPSTDIFDISIETMGDRNNDGYDDLMVGLPNIDRDGTSTHSDDGGIVIIEGRRDADGSAPNIIQANPNAFATGTNQTLSGNAVNNFMSNDNATNTGTRFLGAGGDDHFRVYGTVTAELNGGSDYDAVEFMSGGLIHLGAMGENLSGMERIIMAGGTSTLRLGIDDIFRLLQESSDGTLTIDGGPTAQLMIDDNTGTNPTTENLTHFGFTYTGTAGGHASYDFGAYTVYIGDTMTTQVA